MLKMAYKVLIILGVLSAACLALPSPEASEGIKSSKHACVDSRGEGRCVPTFLCKPGVQIRHPITPPCEHYYELCCPIDMVVEWMPPDLVP